MKIVKLKKNKKVSILKSKQLKSIFGGIDLDCEDPNESKRFRKRTNKN